MSWPSDEDLTAYLDGELPEEDARRIAAALEQDDALLRRLEALTIDVGRMREAFDPLLGAAPPPPRTESTVAEPPPAGRPRAGRRQTMVAAAIGAMGLIGGWLLATAWPETEGEEWRELAAAYHALYTPATLATAAHPEARIAAELSRASAALGAPLPSEIVAGAEALDYRRTQLLGFQDRPIAQIAFLSADGAPIALCIFRPKDARSTPLRMSTLQNMPAATWSRDGLDFLLIGGEDRSLVEKAAKFFVENL